MNINLYRKSIVFGIIFLFIGASVISSTGMVTNKSDYNALPGVNNDDELAIELNVFIPKIKFDSIQKNGITYAALEMPDQGFTTIVGEPRLPVIRFMVEIPQDANPEISVTSDSWEYTSLADFGLPSSIIPVQHPVEKTKALEDVEFVLDSNYYSNMEPLQTDTVRIVETGEIRGRRFALVEVPPVHYTPSSGELEIITSCEIRIGLPDANMTKTYEKILRYSSPAFEELFKALFVNYGDFNGYGIASTPKDQDGYLIIVYDSFYDEILPLSTWKEIIGYDVIVTNTSDIPGGPTKENIHDYIEIAYNNWTTPPSYVLLVGDTGQIPTYDGSDAPSSGTATDLYYVTMDTDMFPDIFIGRFPASTESHVTAMVDKTIYYEQGNFPSTDWIKKAAFMAGNDNYQISEGTHNYVISNYLEPNGYICDKNYEVTYGATTQDVRDSLNDGRSLAIFSGHGSTTSWADGPSFSQSDVNGLTNQDMYPFVCSHACVTGKFTVNECFGETWLRAENKAGLAFWGSSHNTYWDPDDVLEKKMFYSWWNDSLETLGGMTDMALYYHYQYQGGGYYGKMYLECYNILGDPSVKIWSDEPNPDYPPIIANVQATPSVQVVDEWVNINCYVFDSSGVDCVKVNITYPGGTSINQTMDFIPGHGSSTDIYYYNATYSTLGIYSFFIWANDTYNNQIVSGSYTFEIGEYLLIHTTDLLQGWNFVSLPFNQSINPADFIVKYNGSDYSWAEATDPSNGPIVDPNIYGWDRALHMYFQALDALEPGYGYWVYAYIDCELWEMIISVTSDSHHITNLELTWNAIGTPCNQSVNITDLIVHYNGTDYSWAEATDPIIGPIVDPNIYGWERSQSMYFQASDALEPGYAYWMYAYQECNLRRLETE